MIKGVSQNEEIITNEAGGKQAKSEYAFHLIDPEFLLAIAERMKFGEVKGYERDNWKNIDCEDHFNHMLVHYYAWLTGNTEDDHLAGMITRCMMLYATAKQNKDSKDYPKYKSCENCKYIELPWFAGPCNSCFNEKYWEAKR